ncbi:MAG: hypothetical protein AAFX53_02990 [Bacteroidota bacterium]
MKRKIHQLCSIVMALFLLASTTTWTVGKHYCMGLLVDLSFFSYAMDCGMDMELSKGLLEIGAGDSCCSDQFVVVEGQNELGLSLEDITHTKLPLFIPHSVFSLPYSKERFTTLLLGGGHPPPLLVKDIQLLGEVFLI